MKKMIKFTAVAVAMALGSYQIKADLIVSPNDRIAQSGSHFSIDGFSGPAEMQNVYGTRNFSGPVSITGIAFRLDENKLGLSFEAIIPRDDQNEHLRWHFGLF